MNNNAIYTNTHKIHLFQCDGNSIKLNVVSFHICSDGILVNIPNTSKTEVYEDLKSKHITYKINNLGVYNVGIKLTTIDSFSLEN